VDRKNAVRFVVAGIIGLAILFYLFWSMGFENIWNLFLRVKVDYFIYAALFYFAADLFGAYALKLALNNKIRLREILPSHMCGMLYSGVTPGRVGYYYTAFSLSKKTSDRRSKNIGILTLMQGISFFIKAITCILAIIYFSKYFVSPESINYLYLASFVPFIFVLIIVVALYTDLFNRIFARIPLVNRILEYFVPMQHAVREISSRRILDFALINIIGWFLVGAQWYFLGQALGLNLSYLDAFLLQPLLSAVMFIPLTPSGLGITEGGSALLFPLILQSMPSMEAKAAGVTFILLVRLNSAVVDAFGLIDMRIHAKKD
jgi:uncharacterized protein (TIRG00374 family)